MSDIGAPTPSRHVEGVFLSIDGEQVGSFSGMVYSNGTRLDGHGKGTFEPPQPVKGNESAAQVRFVVPGEIDVTIEKARVRSGVITFIAWHSEK